MMWIVSRHRHRPWGRPCIALPPAFGVGRFTVISDPQSAVFGILKWTDPVWDRPGQAGWHELCASHWEQAFTFYRSLFGWKKADAMAMGEMGTYQLFTDGGAPIGGMFNRPAQVAMPCWLFYFNAGPIDAAADRVRKAGGQIVNGPMEEPGKNWIVQCLDPREAMFALLGTKGA